MTLDSKVDYALSDIRAIRARLDRLEGIAGGVYCHLDNHFAKVRDMLSALKDRPELGGEKLPEKGCGDKVAWRDIQAPKPFARGASAVRPRGRSGGIWHGAPSDPADAGRNPLEGDCMVDDWGGKVFYRVDGEWEFAFDLLAAVPVGRCATDYLRKHGKGEKR